MQTFGSFRRPGFHLVCLNLALSLPLICPAAELGTASAPAAPKSLAEARAEAELAIKKFRIPAGLKMDVFAAEPQLANPVSFCLDEQGRIYVAETYRYRTSAL